MDVTQEIEQRAQWSAPAWAASSISCVTSTLGSVYSTNIFRKGSVNPTPWPEGTRMREHAALPTDIRGLVKFSQGEGGVYSVRAQDGPQEMKRN